MLIPHIFDIYQETSTQTEDIKQLDICYMMHFVEESALHFVRLLL